MYVCVRDRVGGQRSARTPAERLSPAAPQASGRARRGRPVGPARSGTAGGATWCARGPVPVRRPPHPHGAPAHNASRRAFRSAQEPGVGRLRPLDGCASTRPALPAGSGDSPASRKWAGERVGPQEGTLAVRVGVHGADRAGLAGGAPPACVLVLV